jgi:hypothetical protein
VGGRLRTTAAGLADGGLRPRRDQSRAHGSAPQSAPTERSDDAHFLLLDIKPLAITGSDELIDWFHGGRHLEVWTRTSDLDTRSFANIWCVIRTDARSLGAPVVNQPGLLELVETRDQLTDHIRLGQ